MGQHWCNRTIAISFDMYIGGGGGGGEVVVNGGDSGVVVSGIGGVVGGGSGGQIKAVSGDQSNNSESANAFQEVRNRNRRDKPNPTAEQRVKNNFTRLRATVIGRKPSSGVMSWGGANLTTECYIGRVGMDVTADDIMSDLVKLDVGAISVDENDPGKFSRGRYKSFKLVVKETSFAKLNSPDFWPEGVVFRRFHRPRPRDVSGHVSTPIA